MAKLDDGIVEVEIDGDRYELKPTVDAIRRISRAYKGLAPALAALQNVDVDAIAQVILAGAGVHGQRAKSLEAAIALRPMAYLEPAANFLAGILDDGDSGGADGADSGNL